VPNVSPYALNYPLPPILCEKFILKIEFKYSDQDINWDMMSDLYTRAPLGNKSASDLRTVFKNSQFKCFVFVENKLVGAGRALSDGLDCSYISDVALLPEYQGKGIGAKIVSYLVEKSRGHKKIILFSTPGKEGFYKKLGFKRMNTAMAIFENQEWAKKVGLINET
jgi:ribosomal protein S18 acetylase RimI-like enzyme